MPLSQLIATQAARLDFTAAAEHAAPRPCPDILAEVVRLKAALAAAVSPEAVAAVAAQIDGIDPETMFGEEG